jgi:uncharacterized protein with HEPN domain
MSALRRDANYLPDIVEAIHRIADYTAGLSRAHFLNDTKAQGVPASPTRT